MADDDFQKIAGSRVPLRKYDSMVPNPVKFTAAGAVVQKQDYAKMETENQRLRAEISRLRGVIEAAVKGCRSCGGCGKMNVPYPDWIPEGPSRVDCPACRELRKAMEENHGPLR